MFEAILFATGRQLARRSLLRAGSVVEATFEEGGVEFHAHITKDRYSPVSADVVYMPADRPLPISFEGDVKALNAYWEASQSQSMRSRKLTYFSHNAGGLVLYPDKVPIQDLSSGERDAIGLCAPVLKGGFSGILLIDKPDRFFDPLRAPGIVRSLRKIEPSVQMIIATDNDHLWDDALSWERSRL